MMEQETKNKKRPLFIIPLILTNLILLFIIWYLGFFSPTPTRLQGNRIENADIKSEELNAVIENYLRKQLNFSDQQLQRFREMQTRFTPRVNALRAETNRLRGEIAELLFSDNRNKSRIEQLSYELGLTHEKLEKEIFFYFIDLMDQCKPEQRESLKTLLRKVFEKYRPTTYPGAGTEIEQGKNLPDEYRSAHANVPMDVPVAVQPQQGRTPRFDRPLERNERESNMEEPRFRGDKPGGNGSDRVKKDMETLTPLLGLTPGQVKQVELILQKFHAQEDEGRGKGGQDPEALKRLKDDVDRQIAALLTPQQLQQFKKFKEERRQKPRDGKQKPQDDKRKPEDDKRKPEDGKQPPQEK